MGIKMHSLYLSINNIVLRIGIRLNMSTRHVLYCTLITRLTDTLGFVLKTVADGEILGVISILKMSNTCILKRRYKNVLPVLSQHFEAI